MGGITQWLVGRRQHTFFPPEQTDDGKHASHEDGFCERMETEFVVNPN